MSRSRAIDWRNDDWFCHGVLDGSLPVERLFENESALAFLAPKGHRNRKYEVHAIAIPKQHIETLLDVTGAEAGIANALLEAVSAAAQRLDLDSQGFFVRANVLPPYQGTGHVHLHLLSGKRKKKEA
jgi:diadenosine tetraphosphate (Ap4A) HIT family hydrolase